MHPDMLDVVMSKHSMSVLLEDKGLTWISMLHLSLNPRMPYIIYKHVSYSSNVLQKEGLHYPEQSLLCGLKEAGKPDGYLESFTAVEEMINNPETHTVKHCLTCLKHSSFILGVTG